MKLARIIIETKNPAAVSMFQAVCEDRGQCLFYGNRRGDGDEVTLFVGMERDTEQHILQDARTLAHDLTAAGVDFELKDVNLVGKGEEVFPYTLPGYTPV